MSRIRVVLLVLAVITSGCAASHTVVGDSGADSLGPRVGETLTDLELAAALATPVPEPTPIEAEAPKPTPTPTPTPEPVRRADPAAATGSGQDSASPSVGQETTRPKLAESFSVGSCYRSAGYQAGEAIPCTEPHQAEVVMVGEFWHGPDAAYPTNAEANNLINEACLPVAEMFSFGASLGVATLPYWPQPRYWAAGDRSFVCFLQFDTSITSSMASISANREAEVADHAADLAQRAADHQEALDEQLAGRIMNIGDCAYYDGVTKAPCNGSHTYVAFARANIASAGGVYPGESLVFEQARDYCGREYELAGLQGSQFFFYPNQWEWESQGIHLLVCLST